jgi:hypothetical protein
MQVRTLQRRPGRGARLWPRELAALRAGETKFRELQVKTAATRARDAERLRVAREVAELRRMRASQARRRAALGCVWVLKRRAV